MINFRYHVVSLTAVFLALVIGIAMGTTVVSKATVDGLRSNLARAEAHSDSVNATNHKLSDDLKTVRRNGAAVDSALSEQVLGPAVANDLRDVPVLVISSRGISSQALDRSLAALTAAGAKVDGTLLVNDRLALTGDDKARTRRHAAGRRRTATFAESCSPGWHRCSPPRRRCPARAARRPRPPPRLARSGPTTTADGAPPTSAAPTTTLPASAEPEPRHRVAKRRLPRAQAGQRWIAVGQGARRNGLPLRGRLGR